MIKGAGGATRKDRRCGGAQVRLHRRRIEARRCVRKISPPVEDPDGAKLPRASCTRQHPGGNGFTTDNGNVILDVHGLSITDPVAMEAKIRGIVGVVTVGLRARGADVILLGTDIGVKTLKPGR